MQATPPLAWGLYRFQHITQCNFSLRSHRKEPLLEIRRISPKICKQPLTLAKGYPPICLPPNRKDTKKQVFSRRDSQILACQLQGFYIRVRVRVQL